VTSVSGTGTASGLTLSGSFTTSGSLTLSGTVNSLAAGTYGISISGNAATATNAGTVTLITTIQTIFATAGAAAMDVGTYALLRAVAGGPFVGGDTLSGGNLSQASASGAPRLTGPFTVLVVGGSWRCMGQCDAGTLDTVARPNQTTLWLRFA
jgi:hypothetical protein